MKILTTTYQTAFQNPGGGEIQLSKTVDAVRDRGHYVETFDPFESHIDEFDILHAYSSHGDNKTTLSWAANHETPIALSTIYWEPMEYIKERSGYVKYLKMIEELGKRTSRHLGITYLDTQKQLYDTADVLLPNSEAEAKLISNKFNISREKFHIVPNAVDRRFAEADSDNFVDEYGKEDFILFVGVISPRKNLATALEALTGLNRDIVVIGPIGDEDYAQKCRTVAPEKTTFIGGLDHDSPMLASAYAASEVFLLPSWYETPGLAALESALACSKIAITDRGSTEEYFQDHAEYLDPADPASIRGAVERSLSKEVIPDLKNEILQNYMWEDTARETVNAYKKISNYS